MHRCLLILLLTGCSRAPAEPMTSDASTPPHEPISFAARPALERDAGSPHRHRHGDGGARKVTPPDPRVVHCQETATDWPSLKLCLEAIQ